MLVVEECRRDGVVAAAKVGVHAPQGLKPFAARELDGCAPGCLALTAVDQVACLQMPDLQLGVKAGGGRGRKDGWGEGGGPE